MEVQDTEITDEYFVPDERNNNVVYVIVTGNFKWLDDGITGQYKLRLSLTVTNDGKIYSPKRKFTKNLDTT